VLALQDAGDLLDDGVDRRLQRIGGVQQDDAHGQAVFARASRRSAFAIVLITLSTYSTFRSAGQPARSRRRTERDGVARRKKSRRAVAPADSGA
jgi:hypothetical protein